MLMPFFQWLEDLALGVWIRETTLAAPLINVMHLLALVIVFGSLLVVDLRLLGRGMAQQPLAKVARAARPWLLGGLLCMLLTGVLQILYLPMREYYSPFFWTKMRVLVVALVFTFTIRHNVTMMDEDKVGPAWGKVVGLVSMALWTWIAVEGRLIGLLS
jgi:hypothetical protein